MIEYFNTYNKSEFTKLFSLLVVLVFSAQALSQDYKRHTYTVSKVVDGDTFWAISDDGVNTKFRLIGIDCPESRHPRKPKQPFSKEATTFLKHKIDSTTVYLEYGIDSKDRYGRELVYVFNKNGDNINAELVLNGLARVTTYVPNIRYESLFIKNQKIARDLKLGMWSIEYDYSSLKK